MRRLATVNLKGSHAAGEVKRRAETYGNTFASFGFGGIGAKAAMDGGESCGDDMCALVLVDADGDHLSPPFQPPSPNGPSWRPPEPPCHDDDDLQLAGASADLFDLDDANMDED